MHFGQKKISADEIFPRIYNVSHVIAHKFDTVNLLLIFNYREKKLILISSKNVLYYQDYIFLDIKISIETEFIMKHKRC